jgi:nitrate/nitrite-specific signal transduction histidine kinase
MDDLQTAKTYFDVASSKSKDDEIKVLAHGLAKLTAGLQLHLSDLEKQIDEIHRKTCTW